MPFSTFTTFADAQIIYSDTYTFRDVGSASAKAEYNATGESGYLFSSSSSSSYLDSYQFTAGLNDRVISNLGLTSNSAYSISQRTPVDTGFYTFSESGSAGTAYAITRLNGIIFVPNGGFISIDDPRTSSYSFSSAANSQALGRLDTVARILGSGTDTTFRLSRTSLTTRTSTILSISTTWTDITTTLSNAQRTYTDISATTQYGTAIGGLASANGFDGEALIIQPRYGGDWTRDGSSLEYLHIFTSEGSFGPFHTAIIKDNESIAQTFEAQKTALSANIEIPLGQESIYTIVSSSNRSITYDYTTYIGSTTLTFGTSYSFNGTQFYRNTSSKSSYSFPKLTIVSTSSVQTVNAEFTFDANTHEEPYIHGFYTTTRAIQAFSTDIFYAIDQNLSYFSLLTYRGTISTTTSQKYVLIDAGSFYSYSGSTTSSSIFTEHNSGLGYSLTDSFTLSRSSAVTEALYRRSFYKRLYSFGIGAEGSAWTKYYTQYSPNFNYVVGGQSDSINGYRQSLTPTALITKLYFTTYKFERGGVVNAPILAIPIDYTSESNAGTQFFYTYQSVNVPNEFCLGSASASVYWTESVDGGTTNTTYSFTLLYAGVESVLTSGEFTQNDFSGSFGKVPYGGGIYHTKGLVNTANAANWSKDGYYYWDSDLRKTDGTTPNAISVVGNGSPITYIATEWVTDRTFPVVSILKSHANSYSY